MESTMISSIMLNYKIHKYVYNLPSFFTSPHSRIFIAVLSTFAPKRKCLYLFLSKVQSEIYDTFRRHSVFHKFYAQLFISIKIDKRRKKWECEEELKQNLWHSGFRCFRIFIFYSFFGYCKHDMCVFAYQRNMCTILGFLMIHHWWECAENLTLLMTMLLISPRECLSLTIGFNNALLRLKSSIYFL
jgi:hypothetical protein